MHQKPKDTAAFAAASRALCALTTAVAEQTDADYIAQRLDQAASDHATDAPCAALLLQRMKCAAHQAAPSDAPTGARSTD